MAGFKAHPTWAIASGSLKWIIFLHNLHTYIASGRIKYLISCDGELWAFPACRQFGRKMAALNWVRINGCSSVPLSFDSGFLVSSFTFARRQIGGSFTLLYTGRHGMHQKNLLTIAIQSAHFTLLKAHLRHGWIASLLLDYAACRWINRFPSRRRSKIEADAFSVDRFIFDFHDEKCAQQYYWWYQGMCAVLCVCASHSPSVILAFPVFFVFSFRLVR